MLIFSYNDIYLIENRIKFFLQYVDEIVIIDSSTNVKQKEMLNNLANEKIKVFNTPAFGFVEPFRNYGIQKCNSEWIFNIDTDELPNELLLKELKNIISDEEYDYFEIYRENIAKNGKKLSDEYILNRLFKNGKIEYKGYVHENPIISGKGLKLPKSFKIINIKAPNSTSLTGILNGMQATKFYERVSFLDSVSNLISLSGVSTNNMSLGKLKELRFSKISRKELSIFGYLFFDIIRFCLSILNFKNFHFRTSLVQLRYSIIKHKMFFKVSKLEREDQFHLSTEIRINGGIINFLNLTNDFVMGKLIDISFKLDIFGEPFFTWVLNNRTILTDKDGEKV